MREKKGRGESREEARPPRAQSRRLHGVVFRAGDEVILQIRGKIHKIRAVTGDAHDKVTVLLRVLLGGQKRLAVEHVELHVPELEVAEGADERDQFFRALLAFQALGRELDVQHAGRAVAHTHILGVVVGKQHGRGAV